MSTNSFTRVSHANAAQPRASFEVLDIQSKLRLALSTVNPALSDRVNIVAIEKVNGKKICKIEADLSRFDALKRAVVAGENPNNAEAAGILYDIVRLGSRLSIFNIDALEIVHLNLANTNVSSRSVVGKFTWSLEGQELEIVMPKLLKSLAKLNLSNTLATDSVFSHLHRLAALKEVSLDGCAISQTFPKSAGSNTLEKISCIGTGFFSTTYLKELHQAFPFSVMNTTLYDLEQAEPSDP